MTKRQDKYQLILEAAVEAIAETGFYQCQVSKIARLAGVADGTIYLYFKNKEDILIRLFQERMGEFIVDVRDQIAKCQTTSSRLKAIMAAHFNYMEKNRSYAIVTQLEVRQSDSRIRNAIREPVLEYFRVIEEVIERGIESKDIANVNVRAARQMIFGAMDEAVTDWLMARKPRLLLNQVEPIFYLFAGALRLQE
ncbi:MAG: transcriptional regulator [Desulfosporosinus sp. BRH_c37]|nr:MAG: transcriptional regulator [Desulfosporosinus sp. BRH_c37]